MNREIIDCPADGPLFAAVLSLSKLAKSTVGFMPDAAFRDRAERGTLLLATSDDHLTGYVLYDLPRDEVWRGGSPVTRPGCSSRCCCSRR